MKLSEMHENVQAIAAETLSIALKDKINLMAENRTESAKQIAETVRKAFEELFID